MSFGIMRCSKIKGASGGTGAYIHNERKREKSNTNPDIEFEHSSVNYSMGHYDKELNYNQRADKRISEGYTGKKAIRKDAVKMVEFLFASSDLNSLSGENHRLYLKDCYEWLCDKFGKDNIIADKVHLDEKTPHLHAIIVPLTEDGRLSCKEVIGGPKQLQQLQNSFYEEVSRKYGLERGEKADLDNPNRIPKKHIPQLEYKKTTLNKMDKEIEQKKSEIKSDNIVLRIKKNEIEGANFKLKAMNNIVSEAQEEKEKIEGSIFTLQGKEKQLKDDITELIDKYERLEKAPPKIKEKIVEKIVPVMVEKEVEVEVEVPVEVNIDYKELYEEYSSLYNNLINAFKYIPEETYENLRTEILNLGEDYKNLIDNIDYDVYSYSKGLSR